MAKFIVRRLIIMLLTMLFISMVIFVVVEIMPGNVARKVLGTFATPQQEESFRKQLGLDRSPVTRYLDWLLGNDWRADNLVGMPLRRIKRPGSDFYGWWAVDESGNLVRWELKGEDLIAQRLQPDGTITKSVDNERWQTNEEGVSKFWGVDNRDHAVLWEKGSGKSFWVRAGSAGWWVEKKGGAERYIPLHKGLLRGDLGKSIKTGRSVGPTILRRLIKSGILAGIAFAVCMPLALLLGLIAGLREGTLIDRILSIGGLIGTSTPHFATGIFLILIFATWLKLVPGATVYPRGILEIFQSPEMLILPVLTLTVIELGYILRITRSSMVEVMNTDYIRTAFMKGLPYRRIVFKHAVRNALLAPITVIMLHVNWLMGGLVVVEAIFGYKGLGYYIYQSGLYHDIFALEACGLVMVFLAVGTQLIADVIYSFLNPRIRYG
jgi:peptide/nickel transport system permease protein